MIKAESWVLMALQQCKAIVHFVAPPELLTVGHNPYSNPSVVDAHIPIPSMRPKFMSELLSGDANQKLPDQHFDLFRVQECYSFDRHIFLRCRELGSVMVT
jgi:hypothetical protein